VTNRGVEILSFLHILHNKNNPIAGSICIEAWTN